MGSVQAGIGARVVSAYYAANRVKILARTKAWAIANPEKRREIEARHRRRNGRKVSDAVRFASRTWGPEREWLRLCLLGTRIRAKNAGLEFTLTFYDLALPEVCPILGLKLVYARGRGRANWDAPSVDRIDPSKGYTPDNCRVISLRANTLRSNCTDPGVFLALALDAEQLFRGTP